MISSRLQIAALIHIFIAPFYHFIMWKKYRKHLRIQLNDEKLAQCPFARIKSHLKKDTSVVFPSKPTKRSIKKEISQISSMPEMRFMISEPHQALQATHTSILSENKDCIICLGPQPSKGRLVPCGHASFCFECCMRLTRQPNAKCPLCRTVISQVNQETTSSGPLHAIPQIYT